VKTVCGPESTAGGRERNCVKFSQTVCRQQIGIVRQQRRRQCCPGTQDVDSASGLRSAAPGQRQNKSPTRVPVPNVNPLSSIHNDLRPFISLANTC